MPARLTDPVPVVLVGCAVWALAAAALGVLALTGARPLDAWFAATLVGLGLGAVGLVVLALQRRAARRGSRGAQRL